MAEARSTGHLARTADPPFAFFWRTPSDGRVAETLLIWPLDERSPPGRFARFVVIEDQFGHTRLMAPMDFASAAPAAGTRDQPAALPMLLAVPGIDRCKLRVDYLVRRSVDGGTRVELVHTAPVEFRNLDPSQANRLVLLGLIRGRNSDGPVRPIILTDVRASLELDDRSASDAPTHVDIADRVFRAYERTAPSAERSAGMGFVFAVPSAGHTSIGPMHTIAPYKGATLRASAKILKQATETSPPPQNDTISWPRLSVAIGTSQINRAMLAPAVMFFSWDRSVASLQARQTPQGDPIRHHSPASLQRGTIEGGDLACVFKAAGFGDVVGMMVGPTDCVRPVFAEWRDDDLLIPELPQDRDARRWTVALFYCLGDELMPLRYLVGTPDGGKIIAAAEQEILKAAQRHLPPAETHFVPDTATFLLAGSPGPESDLTRMIRTAFDAANLVAAAHSTSPDDQPADRSQHLPILDHYCELVRELDRQIAQTLDRGEWLRLNRLFAFPQFLRLPQLHRALVAAPDLRRMAAGALEDLDSLLDQNNLLVVAMRLLGIQELDSARKQHWLKFLDLPSVFAAWELIKRDPECVSDLISLGIAPDLALLADHLDGTATARLQAYRECTVERLASAAMVRKMLGYVDRERMLEEVGYHRRDDRVDKPIMPYGRIVAALQDMAEATPLADEIKSIVLALDQVISPGRPDPRTTWNRLEAAVAPPPFGWREWLDQLPQRWERRRIVAERVDALSQLLHLLAAPQLSPLKMRVASLLREFDARLP
jgi:hypothetical protein